MKTGITVLPRKVFAYIGAWFAALAAAPALAETGAPVPWQKGFQKAASPSKEHIEAFHNDILLPITIAISLLILVLLLVVIVRFNARANPKPSRTAHNTMLEVVWTLVPVLLLVVIIIPSMKVLYFVDRTENAEMTLKVTGYQWYWGYTYPDHGDIEITANMVPDDEIKEGQLRLLSTDNVIVLPVETNIRILTTASDVLHAWAVPALGVKLDAIPGQLNETWMRIDREGTFYGQCSELCGTNHAFMPIEIRAVPKAEFAAWVEAQGGKMPGMQEEEQEQEKTEAGEL